MARAAVTTTLSAALGGLTGLLIKRLLPSSMGGTGLYDIGANPNPYPDPDPNPNPKILTHF